MKKTITNPRGCIALAIAVQCAGFPAPGFGATRVVAWGAGTAGSTGTPHFGQCIVPAGLTNVTAIAAGYVHSAALKTDGTVVIWPGAYANLPPTTNAVAITAGHAAQHTLVLQADGTVVAGGNICCGLVGMPASSNLVAVSGGYYSALGLRANGTVMGWGTNQFSGAWTNAVAVSDGYWGGLALKADGSVVKWQDTGPGQIAEVAVPAELSNVVAVAAGGYGNDLALRADGTVFAWGSGAAMYVPPGLSNVIAIAAGDYHCLALKADGTVAAWCFNDFNNYGQANVPAGLSNVVAIAAGGFHSLALAGDGPQALQAPMKGPAIGPNGFSVSVPSQSGRVYALEFKNRLTDSNWTALPLAAGANGWLALSDASANNSQRFYRVLQW